MIYTRSIYVIQYGVCQKDRTKPEWEIFLQEFLNHKTEKALRHYWLKILSNKDLKEGSLIFLMVGSQPSRPHHD